MNVFGIVAEYNPFHMGHLYHMQETIRRYGNGEGAVVCVMSGSFVQRGDIAVFDKYARAEAAVRSGADLVLELPLPWALASAARFAGGAVGILGGLGVVTHISFGSECGNIEQLTEVAVALLDPMLDEELRLEFATQPVSYPVARQRVLERRIGDAARILESPNNLLAVEYIKALYDQMLDDIQPVTIERLGAGHDSADGSELYHSASELRGMLQSGYSIAELLPREAAKVYAREELHGRGPVLIDHLELPIISRLRALKECDFAALPDATEGLENRLFRACLTEPTLEGILSAAKTKRYALSRLRRMLICAALGITAEHVEYTPPYTRLLAANDVGRELLREVKRRGRIPVIDKPASVKELPMEEKRLFRIESSATDFYVLGYRAVEERRGGSAWRDTPFIL